jgi:hypothetical protein
MRQVSRLFYRLTNEGKIVFHMPHPCLWETRAFRLKLENGQADIELKEDHTTPDSARAVVERQLLTWEIATALSGLRGLHFEYDHAQLVDEQGSVTASRVVALEVSHPFSILPPELDHYPDPPPSNFIASEDVQRLWRWYCDYMDRREPRLAVMGWLCFSWLQHRAHMNQGGKGGKKPLKDKLFADYYTLEEAVVEKFRTLCSKVGDLSQARKFDEKSELRSYTQEENNWLLAAVRILIRRVGEIDADPNAPRSTIGMAELPPL